MTLKDLIQTASVRPISTTDLHSTASALHLSQNALCDAFAREVAEGYLSGKYSWQLGDIAMNHLFAFAHGNDPFELPDFAWRVYLAFDQGEYIRQGKPSDLDGEPRTKAMLTELSAQDPAR